jgi:hypothetical protein
MDVLWIRQRRLAGRRVLVTTLGGHTIRYGGATRTGTWNRSPAPQAAPAFFGKFAAAQVLNDPAVFPLGVFLADVQTSSDVSSDAAAGLNLYLSLTTASNLAALAGQNQMHAILQVEDPAGSYPWPTALASNPPGSEKVIGWNLGDEFDMTDGSTVLTHVDTNLAQLSADGRFRYINWGKGVAFWRTEDEAASFLNHAGIDVVSDDLYFFTDDDLFMPSQGAQLLWTDGGWPAPTAANLSAPEARAGANYGAVVRRLRRLMQPAGNRPVWNFIELGHPSSEATRPTITGPQIVSAVWHSIIAGATGIMYFNHSFGGSYQTSNILRDPNYSGIRTTVTALNQRITGYAPVINSSTWGGCSVTKGAVRWMYKVQGGHRYLFAASSGITSQQVTFTVPAGTTATVLDESRSIPISGGSFTDTFADANAVHIYRLD